MHSSRSGICTNRASGFDISTHTLAFAKLPVELKGARLVQISDLHRRSDHPDDLIAAAVAEVNALDADFVVITGDFVDGPARDIIPVVRIVAGLRARRGVFATLGNHDHRGDPGELTQRLEQAGITVLTNRSMRLSPGFWLAGVDDLFEGKPDLSGALSCVPMGEPAILLSHDPSVLDRLAPDRELVVLSGHTHGGQMVLPFLPPRLVCRFHLGTEYVHGWFHLGRVRMYVNRGIGVTGSRLFARRINCPPEIACFTLTCIPAEGVVDSVERTSYGAELSARIARITE
ncbi:MAG: metallophosphoesterase [Chthonomonadales bacterium]